MYKHNICFAARLCIAFLVAVSLFGYAAAGAETGQNADDTITIEYIAICVDGKPINRGIKIGDVTYVGLRNFSESVRPGAVISWDAATETASVKVPGLTVSAGKGKQYITANDRCLFIPDGVMNIDGCVMVPIRELSRAFGAGIIWDAETKSIEVETKGAIPIEDADKFYDKEDMMWLARIINAESGNQSLMGKIAVGNVVVNRVNNPYCPDSIYLVIFDNKHGVQFQPTITGAIYKEPNEESLIAAKICLEGYNLVGDSLFFVNPDIGITEWFAQTRTYVVTLGDHDFYA